ncbi:MAG: hypothetical protein JXR70_01760 [Spirochaetales bacterium]|nr:hypothetical protein [Spirochaetales bacterium]
MSDNKPAHPNKYLILGVVSILLGGVFLLWTLDFLPSYENLWPVPIIFFGMVILYLVFIKGKNEIYIIPGMIFTFGGIFFLLMNTILSKESLERWWPVAMFITGISLLPYAYRKREKYQVAIIIPAIFIILLSLIFLIFSLGKPGINFTNFISDWWPVLLIISGLFLIMLYLNSDSDSDSDTEDSD